MTARERIPIAAALAVALLAAGCGGESKHYSDKQIIDKLNLVKSENGYMLDGDQFCEVERQLLNDADEVNAAADKDDLGLVIASGEGNVGVSGVPVFSPDCKDLVKKKLNKLDPRPSD